MSEPENRYLDLDDEHGHDRVSIEHYWANDDDRVWGWLLVRQAIGDQPRWIACSEVPYPSADEAEKVILEMRKQPDLFEAIRNGNFPETKWRILR